MLSALKALVPAPRTGRASCATAPSSSRVAAGLVAIEIRPRSVRGHDGVVLPIAIAHGEGRAEFADAAVSTAACRAAPVPELLSTTRRSDGALSRQPERFTTGHHGAHEPRRPRDDRDAASRARVIRSVLHSWHPDDWREDGPWMRMFRNARVWVG
jgi:phosphoribosylformylglycinamidine synthase